MQSLLLISSALPWSICRFILAPGTVAMGEGLLNCLVAWVLTRRPDLIVRKQIVVWLGLSAPSRTWTLREIQGCRIDYVLDKRRAPLT